MKVSMLRSSFNGPFLLLCGLLTISLASTGCLELSDEDPLLLEGDEGRLEESEPGLKANYVYAVRVDNTATARTYKIHFSCDGNTTVKGIQGSTQNTKHFDCSEEPVDTQNPTVNVPNVTMKFRAKVGYSYESVTIRYQSAWNNWDESETSTGHLPWDELATGTYSNTYDQIACFDTWEFFGMNASNVSCHSLNS